MPNCARWTETGADKVRRGPLIKAGGHTCRPRFLTANTFADSKILSRRNKEHKVFPYLVKELTIDTPNQGWKPRPVFIKETNVADFRFEHSPFPPADRYPINSSEGKVLPWVTGELEAGPTLVVTGFSSLEFLTRTLMTTNARQPRILIGQEPLAHRQSASGAPVRLPEEMRAWWLEQGFSITTGSAVQDLVGKIDRGEVEFRLLENLHAKIVVGPGAALLGSSNFSHSGMTFLKEANARRKVGTHEYFEIQSIAEAYWEAGVPANDVIRELLLQLLRPTTWQEVLAMAGSLLLEGEWLKQVPELSRRFQDLALWESQKQALSQAFYLLDTFGDSLLVADPTGSGKTRLGAGLHLLLLLRLVALGQSDRMRTLIITPPQVKPSWEKEFEELDANQPDVISQGILSHARASEGVSMADNLKRCRVLFLDEAHNYLNQKSNRSTSLLGHGADHAVLFTATPINRKADDLFRVLNLMDPDNLSDAALKVFDDWGMHRGTPSQQGLAVIRKQLSLFTIRRTKGDLNAFIARNPEGYTRVSIADGVPKKVYCRYPKTDSQTYKLDETAHDIELAAEIEALSWQLRGLVYLKKLTASVDDLSTPEKQQKFLENRIKGATALAAWNVRAMLRSSRAALLEHIHGTHKSCEHFGLKVDDKRTGDLAGNLTKDGFALPLHKLSIELPTWMTEPDERARVLREEVATYRAIAQKSLQISDARDNAKLQLLRKLASERDRILAFDSRVISLEYFQKRLRERGAADKVTQPQVLLVTGGRKEEQRRARELFGLDSRELGWVGLCSDAMAEGVNLQGAQCLVLLDMPSVMRLAEQRIGRIDRMNSPFETIEVWWPEDHPSFALKTDQRFFQTADSVNMLLGSNIDIPTTLTERLRLPAVTGSTAIRLWEESALHANENSSPLAINDSFQDLKGLFWGRDALVPREVYDRVAHLKANTVWSTVASPEPWALLVTNEGIKAPRWTLWHKGRVTIDLGEIVAHLRRFLPPAEASTITLPSATRILQVCREVESHELQLLPHKKRRALRLLAVLIRVWDRDDRIPRDHRTSFRAWADSVDTNGSLFAEQRQEAARYHLANLARRWLEISEPHWAALRTTWTKRRFLSWGSPEVKKTLQGIQLTEREWDLLAKELVSREPLELRIKAVLWGEVQG